MLDGKEKDDVINNKFTAKYEELDANVAGEEKEREGVFYDAGICGE